MTTDSTPHEFTDVTSLYEITKVLASATDLRECLEQIMEVLAATHGMHNGTVTIINPTTSQLEIEVAQGMTAEARKRGKYEMGEGITGRVVASGTPIVVPSISDEPLFLNRTRARGDISQKQISFFCVPITHGRQVIGALSVDREYDLVVNFENDLQFLTILSSLIAQAVVRIQAVNEERRLLLRENTSLKRQLSGKYKISNIVSNSSRMLEVFDMIHRVADSNATVLLRGESGTGKTLVAKALHYNSNRSEKPFVVVNCSALPETLLESELFGHEKGAFTGADSVKKGRFEMAEGGTLFLDEIGELSQAVQIKLLNVIQDREFQRLGGVAPIKCNVRLVTATHVDLEKAVEAGTFRDDFYYRLNVFPVYLPPLRKRRTDILLLAEHFLAEFCRENNKKISRISTPAIDLLIQYHWPGNVRELQNCIERAVLICDGDTIKSFHLPPTLQAADNVSAKNPLSFAAAVENFERELIVEALKHTNGNQTMAAKYLDSSLRIINYKIHKYGIEPRHYKTER
ncbi:MAG: sigma-54-dependent Fis family transcriptional regulator [Desulfobulbaceae bacterium]|nr:MAG: sigma-54-dependent Fis family transcriptional regulator [Desulfobulbaceae bacterium]